MAYVAKTVKPGCGETIQSNLAFLFYRVLITIIGIILLFCLFPINADAEDSTPQTVDVTPKNGSSLPDEIVTFEAGYKDPEGPETIQYGMLRFWIKPSPAQKKDIQLYYFPAGERLYIADYSAGQTKRWYGPYTAGSSRVIDENPHITLYCDGSGGRIEGEELKATWKISFKAPFSGRKYNMYLYARDLGGATTRTDYKGTWTVNPNPPQTVDVTPKNSSSLPDEIVTFEAGYKDPQGPETIKYGMLRFWIKPTPAQKKDIRLYYFPAGERLYIGDYSAGQTKHWYGPYTAGSTQVIDENPHITLYCEGSGGRIEGNELKAAWKVSFKTPFSGARYNMYLYAMDMGYAATRTDYKGRWTVNPNPPQTTEVTPKNGSSLPDEILTFEAGYKDPEGPQTIQCGVLRFWMKSSSSEKKDIQLYYFPAGKRLYIGDYSTGQTKKWYGPYKAGSSQVIDETPHIRLYCDTSGGRIEGDELKATWKVSFKTPASGRRYNMSLYAKDLGFLNSGWKYEGKWTIDATPPEIIITPVTSPTNQDVTLNYTVSDNITPADKINVTGDNSPYTAEGNYNVTLTATDEAGLSSSATISFTIDKTPPAIIITAPADGEVVTAAEVSLKGTIDGVFFSETHTLLEGENTLTKQATDAAGNNARASITVTYHPPQSIDSEGGEAKSQNGDVVVEVPEDAVDAPVLIVAIDRDKEDFPDTQLPQDTEIAGALEVLTIPPDITFQNPVKMNIPLDIPHIPGTPIKIGLLNTDTDTFDDTGKISIVNKDSYTVSTEVDHFSTYAALKSAVSSGTPIGGGVDIPTPDLFTGSFTHEVSIEIPKGRKDMHPNLSLQYRSGNPNTWVGFGWQLNPGYIQRNTKHGPPTYDDEKDTYLFISQSQSTELIHLIDNLYQAKVEGAFIKYYKEADDTWYLLTKDGNKMYLGQTNDSKQTTQDGTFAWYLTEAIDPNGNYVEFNYTKDEGKVYLSNVLYTGNVNTGASPKYEVMFHLEDRSDIASTYISGEKCQMRKRLDYIEVFCNPEIVWTCYLEYEYSPDTARSLLKSVTQKGSDGASYPPRTFEYQER